MEEKRIKSQLLDDDDDDDMQKETSSVDDLIMLKENNNNVYYICVSYERKRESERTGHEEMQKMKRGGVIINFQ